MPTTDTDHDVDQSPRSPLHWLVERGDRPRICAEIVSAAGPTVIRTRSVEAAASLADQLCRRGLPALHYAAGGRRVAARRDYQRFVDGSVPVLVTSGGLHDLRFLISNRIRCVLFYDPCEPRIPMTRSRAVVVTLVVPERVPQLGSGVTIDQPDLEHFRDLVDEAYADVDVAAASKRSIRSRLVRLPNALDGLRAKLRRPHKTARVVAEPHPPVS